MSKDALPASAKEDKKVVTEVPVIVGNVDTGATGTVLDSELANDGDISGSALKTAPAEEVPEEPKDFGQAPRSGGVYVASNTGKLKRADETE